MNRLKLFSATPRFPQSSELHVDVGSGEAKIDSHCRSRIAKIAAQN